MRPQRTVKDALKTTQVKISKLSDATNPTYDERPLSKNIK